MAGAGGVEEGAGVQHPDDAGAHQDEDGKHQINHCATAVLGVLLDQTGIGVGAGEQVARLDGVALILEHGAILDLHHNHGDHHHNGEQGVEVEGDRLDEDGQALAVGHIAGHCGGPGADGGDDAHRGGGGVDEVGQLHPGDVVLVGDGAHDRAHGEAVEVVVNEDQNAQHDGGQLRPHPAFDVLGGPAAEGGGAAGLVHQADHSAQDDQEDQDAHIVAVRQHRDDPVLEHMEHGSLELEAGIEQAAGQDADEQGGVDLLGDQG